MFKFARIAIAMQIHFIRYHKLENIKVEILHKKKIRVKKISLLWVG